MRLTHRCPVCRLDKPLDADHFYRVQPGQCIECKKKASRDRNQPRHCLVCDKELPRGQGPKKWCEDHHPRNLPRRRPGRPVSPPKKDYCEDCGPGRSQGLRGCQLDVRRMDGNKTNHAPSNLRTLCANCQRLYANGLRSNLVLDQDEQLQLERFFKGRDDVS